LVTRQYGVIKKNSTVNLISEIMAAIRKIQPVPVTARSEA